jgi:hypothetical protein
LYIATLRELRSAVEEYYGSKARYLATKPSEIASERGQVRFLLYEALHFHFVVLDPPYSSLSVSRRVDGEAPISDFILGDLTFVENAEHDVLKALDIVDQYCRLLLPDKYLRLFDEA